MSQFIDDSEHNRGIKQASQIILNFGRALCAMAFSLFLAVALALLAFAPLIMIAGGRFELVSIWQLAVASGIPLLLLHSAPRGFIGNQLLFALGDWPAHADRIDAPPITRPTVLRTPIFPDNQQRAEWTLSKNAWGGAQPGVFFLSRPFFSRSAG